MRTSAGLFLLLLAREANAALLLDSSFKPAALERAGSVSYALPAPDGRVFIGGSFATVSRQPRSQVARVLSDGRLDPTFDAGQVAFVTAALPLDDGQLLMAGRLTNGTGQMLDGVFRLQTNGVRDTKFVAALPADMTAYALALAPGGKIVAAGTGGPGIARFLDSGRADPEFDPGRGFSGSVNSVVVQSDGKILAGGFFDSVNAVYRPKLARLNSDGSLDSAFAPALRFWWDDFIYSLALRPDGKVWVAGSLEQVELWPNPEDISGYRMRCVALLQSDGGLDGSFTNLFGLFDFVRSMAVLDDGRLVVQGEFYTINDQYHPNIARLNRDGSLDSSFNPPMSGSHLAAQPGGRVLLCDLLHWGDGWSTSVVRLQNDGTVDESFRVVTGAPAEVTAVARQPDGKLLVAGDFRLADGAPSGGLERLNADGSLDLSFDAGSGPAGQVTGLVVLRNSQILVAGRFSSFNGTRRSSLCRLQADGRIDGSYELNFGGVGQWNTEPAFRDTAVAPDGKIMLTGIFSGPRYNLVRLNADGSLDESFTPNWGGFIDWPPHYWPSSLLWPAQGGIYVGGGFSDCGIASEPCSADGNFSAVVRFRRTGASDSRFNPFLVTSHWESLNLLALQPDGRILSTYFNGDSSRLGRMLPVGGLDSSFHGAQTGPGQVRAALLEPNGLIVLAGDFVEIDGSARQRLARLHPDGSLDRCFDPGDSVNGAINGIAAETRNLWLIFGAFTAVNGAARSGLARVRWEDFCLRLLTRPAAGNSELAWTLVGPVNRSVRLEYSTDLVTWASITTNTLPPGGWRFPVRKTDGVAPVFYRAWLLP